MGKLTKSAADMVRAARGQIVEIEADELISRFGDPGIVIVDIRDIRERERSGFIPGSFHAPRGMLEFWVDPESPYHKPIFSEEKDFVLHCASGWRSSLSALTLQEMGFAVSHLKDGFSSWLERGGPVEKPSPK